MHPLSLYREAYLTLILIFINTS
ncbi:hypothetical protein Zm00014a_002831 [Zea mays]|uniref:Uncharacterized protein n=1 Tax=Zea mays TaxID=4577 RepID=A0A3L6F1N9_MAIZE|nr:hypothetical protein Zm00014a_002831 [Zea mays]